MHTAQPSSTSRELRISHARQQVFGGQPSEEVQEVQPWITQSWQRCLGWGLEPRRSVGFDMITAAHKRRSIEANQCLSSAAREVIDQLGQAIAPIRYFVILTDAQGVVVSTAGHIDRQDRRAWLIAREGVDLSERAVGTSAIGAALHEQRDVWLHRGEHFFEDTSVYSCAGSPIFGAQGQCVGMLDVTGIEAPERPELVHLVSSAARRIENRLTLALPHALVLHLRWPGGSAVRGEAEGLICLDQNGCIQGMNSIARQMLGSNPASQASDTHASNLFATDWRCLYDAKLAQQPLILPLWSGLPVEVRSSYSGKLAPKALPASRWSAAALAPSSPLKVQETELIRATVALLKGNVAEAAQKLGISRATIYRKLAMRGKKDD
jgi:sigma-54 dependent transcriptional regulator, acetoin dehydrogenase operon transcriptional activator AcoR